MDDVLLCPDCGAQLQFFPSEIRCPWVTQAHRRVEHEEPGFMIVYCNRPRRQNPIEVRR